MTSRLLSGALLGALVLGLGACGSDDGADNGAADTTSAATSSPAGAAESTAAAPAADRPFGSGCSALPAQGEGSVADLADDPVVTAASHTPALAALVQAVTAANLVDSLNSQQDVTVLAPADAAFGAVPEGDRQALMADTARLTAVLTHHVIAGRLAPDQLIGTHTTLNNDEVTIEGEGATFTIAGEGTVTGTAATVLCGNVPTANATVYIIDQVLAPAG